jgi:hypothetical protein
MHCKHCGFEALEYETEHDCFYWHVVVYGLVLMVCTCVLMVGSIYLISAVN